MFCKNCGKQLPDNSKFCTGCGAQLNAAQPTAEPVAPVAEPVAPVAPAEPESVVAPAAEPVAYTAAEYDTNPVTAEGEGFFAEADFSEEVPLKKKRKKKAILISTISLVLVAAIAIPLFFVFKKDDNLMTAAMEAYHTINRNVAMSEKGKALANLYGAMLESGESGTEIDLTLDASDTLVGMLEGALDVDLSWLKETNINFRYDLSEEIGTLGAAVEIDGDSIINVETIIDTTTSSLFFGIPDWTDTYLRYKFEDNEAAEFLEMYQTILSAGGATEVLPTGDEIADIIDNYADIIDECFQNDDEKDTTLTVGNIKQDVTECTMEITDTEILTAAVQILEQAAEDDDILNVIQKFVDFYVEQDMMDEDDAEMVEEQYVDAINDALEGAQDALDDATGDVMFTLVRYVDDNDMIIGREFGRFDEVFFYHATATDGDKYATVVEAQGVTVIEGEGEVDGNAKTGEYLFYDGKEIVGELTLNNFSLDDYGPNGSITIYPPDEMFDEVADNSMMSSYFSGMKVGIELDFESDKGSFGFAFNIKLGSETLIGLGVKISDYSGSASAPDDYESFENIDRWFATLDIDQIVEELSETAVSELVDMLMDEIGGDLDDLFSLGGFYMDDFYMDDFDYDDFY